MPRRSRPVRLASGLVTVAEPFGLLRTSQLNAAGHDRNEIRRLVAAGALHPVHRAVWSLTSPLSLPARIEAARMALGGGTACLQTAAALWGLAGAPSSVELHISLEPPRTRHQLDGVARHWLWLQDSEIATVDGVPVTTPERLVLDASRRWYRDDLVSLADSVLHTGRSTRLALADLLPRVPVPARAWLDLADGRAESPLETRMRLLLHDTGLGGMFTPQWTVAAGGRTVARIDFAHPGLRLGLECDGRGPHELPEALFRDRSRADDLAALGWRLIRVTWEDVTRSPHDVVARIRRALAPAA